MGRVTLQAAGFLQIDTQIPKELMFIELCPVLQGSADMGASSHLIHVEYPILQR